MVAEAFTDHAANSRDLVDQTSRGKHAGGVLAIERRRVRATRPCRWPGFLKYLRVSSNGSSLAKSHDAAEGFVNLDAFELRSGNDSIEGEWDGTVVQRRT